MALNRFNSRKTKNMSEKWFMTVCKWVCAWMCVCMAACECNAGAAVSLSRSLTLLSVQHSNSFHLHALIISYACKVLSLPVSLSLSVCLHVCLLALLIRCCLLIRFIQLWHLLRTTCLIIEPHKCLTRNLQFTIYDARIVPWVANCDSRVAICDYS